MKEKYTKRLADEMEAHGVALRASGAYVHLFFEKEELERAKRLVGQKFQWEPELFVVVARGRGCLARLAKVSRDRQVANFLGKIITLELLKGEVFSTQQFASHVKTCPIAKLRIQSSGELRIGLVYGSLEEPYASLVDVVNGKLRFTDIETHERSNNRHVVVTILELTAEDAETGQKIREQIAQISEG